MKRCTSASEWARNEARMPETTQKRDHSEWIRLSREYMSSKRGKRWIIRYEASNSFICSTYMAMIPISVPRTFTHPSLKRWVKVRGTDRGVLEIGEMAISAFIGLIGLGPASRVFTCSLLDRLPTATTYIPKCPIWPRIPTETSWSLKFSGAKEGWAGSFLPTGSTPRSFKRAEQMMSSSITKIHVRCEMWSNEPPLPCKTPNA